MAYELEEVKVSIPLKNRLNAFLWFLQRILGGVIILWMLLHTYTNYLITLGPEAYESALAEYESVPGVQYIYILLGIAIAWHAFYGLTLILRDLMTSKQPLGVATKKREDKLIPREISTPRNFPMWFFSGRRLPKRPIWSLHRISAIILLFTVTLHVIHIHLIGGLPYYGDWNNVIATYKDPIWMIYYLIFDFGIAFHGTQGIRIIIMDFTSIGKEGERTVSILSILIGILGFLLLAYIDLRAFMYVSQEG